MTQITNEDIDAADGFDGIVKFKTDLWNNWYLVEMRRDDPVGYYIHPLHGMGMDDATRSYITQLRARAEAAERAYALLHQEIIALAIRKTASDERSIGAHQAANELHERAQELAKMILLAYGENGIWNKRPEATK